MAEPLPVVSGSDALPAARQASGALPRALPWAGLARERPLARGATPRAFLKAGCVRLRQRGSHVRLESPRTGKRFTVDIKWDHVDRAFLRLWLEHAGIAPEEFRELL